MFSVWVIGETKWNLNFKNRTLKKTFSKSTFDQKSWIQKSSNAFQLKLVVRSVSLQNHRRNHSKIDQGVQCIGHHFDKRFQSEFHTELQSKKEHCASE